MVTGGRVLLLVLSVVGVSSLVGCGKTQRSPNSIQDGVLIQDKSVTYQEVQALFPENAVTLVDADEHIYKVRDAQLAEVTEKMPTAYAEEDFVYNFKYPDLVVSKKDSFEEVYTKMNCLKPQSSDPVRAGIRVANSPNFVGHMTVKAGSAPVRFTSITHLPKADDNGGFWDPLKSLFGSSEDSHYTTQWIVEAAPGSSTMKSSTSKDILVTPDRAGEYFVILIVQNNSTGACAVNAEVLGATTNKPYNGPAGTPSQYSAQKFFHVPLVNGEEAWEISQGEGVTIAVIDSGVNYNHPDVSRNIKVNTAEIPDNGIDDDGNGYVDDAYGYDFAIGDAYAYDDQSHGTHVAALAASSTYGLAKKAKILPIKALLPTGAGSNAAIVSAIYYAIKQKADIINMSLGGEGFASPLLLAALKKAQEEGILVVAASGNSKLNTDERPTFLTSRDGTNVLSIAATDENHSLSNFSNFGLAVDLAAPGGTHELPIMSAYAFPEFSMHIAYPGTSMAAPIAAGIAALVKSVNPSLSAEEIKDILMRTGKSSAALEGKIKSGKVINALNAVQEAYRSSVWLRASAQ